MGRLELIELVRSFNLKRELKLDQLEAGRQHGLLFSDGGCWYITKQGKDFHRSTIHVETGEHHEQDL